MRFAVHRAREALPVLQRMALDEPVVLAVEGGTTHLADAISDIVAAPRDIVVTSGIREPGGALIGAVAEGDVCVIDTLMCARLGTSRSRMSALVRERAVGIDTAVRQVRRGGPRVDLRARPVILAVDRLDHGVIAHAAARSARRAGASRVIVVATIAKEATVAYLEQVVDDIVWLDLVVDGQTRPSRRCSADAGGRRARRRPRQRPPRASARRNADRWPWTPCARWTR